MLSSGYEEADATRRFTGKGARRLYSKAACSGGSGGEDKRPALEFPRGGALPRPWGRLKQIGSVAATDGQFIHLYQRAPDAADQQQHSAQRQDNPGHPFFVVGSSSCPPSVVANRGLPMGNRAVLVAVCVGVAGPHRVRHAGALRIARWNADPEIPGAAARPPRNRSKRARAAGIFCKTLVGREVRSHWARGQAVFGV